MQRIRPSYKTETLYNTREQREGIIASEVKEKRRKDCYRVVGIRSFRENRDIGKGSYLRSKGSMAEARSQEENKRRNQKEEASHSEEYRHGFTY